MTRGLGMAALLVAAAAATSSAQQHDTTSPAMPPGMNMPGMAANGMAMPIPMPKGMVMMPGLVGLTPPGGTFLPGAGVDPASLPNVRPSAVVQMRDGDTLDLSATLVRRTIAGRPYVMYGFNGEVPGPLIASRRTPRSRCASTTALICPAPCTGMA